MEDAEKNFDVFQPTTMKNVPNRRILAIRVLKVSQPNRHHSFPSSTRPKQIKSTNSIHFPITPNDYSSPIPPTPCNTPTHSEIDFDTSRQVIASNHLEKNSQRSPVKKKYIIIRKRKVDQNKVADDDGHSPNLSKSPDTFNTQLSKTNSPDTYDQTIDDLENNSIKTRIGYCRSTKMWVILCIFVFLLINGALFGTILGILFTRNLL